MTQIILQVDDATINKSTIQAIKDAKQGKIKRCKNSETRHSIFLKI